MVEEAGRRPGHGLPPVRDQELGHVQGEEEEIEMVTVPKIMGKNRINALDALTKAGLIMDYDRSRSMGTVTMVQYPEGTKIPRGSTVHVEFSGPTTTTE